MSRQFKETFYTLKNESSKQVMGDNIEAYNLRIENGPFDVQEDHIIYGLIKPMLIAIDFTDNGPVERFGKCCFGLYRVFTDYDIDGFINHKIYLDDALVNEFSQHEDTVDWLDSTLTDTVLEDFMKRANEHIQPCKVVIEQIRKTVNPLIVEMLKARGSANKAREQEDN